jgi:hypothetical protein
MSDVKDNAKAAAHIAAMSRKGRPILSPAERIAMAKKSQLDDAAFALANAELAAAVAAGRLAEAKSNHAAAAKEYDAALAGVTLKEGN